MTQQTFKKLLPTIIAVIIIGGASFYAGMQYGQNKKTAAGMGGANFANMTPAERQARMANGGFTGGQRGVRTTNGGAASGEILSKDSTSVTIKLTDGGSKIVFISNSTPVSKTVSGSLADLMVGGQITAIGTANPDGSITAQNIQIRPNTPRVDQSQAR